MKKIFLLCLSLFPIILSGAENSFAQKVKPNFSGTWSLNNSESKTYVFGGEITVFPKQSFNCLVDKTIEHKEPELKVKTITKCREESNAGQSAKTVETNFIYFTDGRGEVNKADNNDLIESVTKWDGNKILTVSHIKNLKNNKKELPWAKELSISKKKEKLFEKSAENKSSFYSPNGSVSNSYTKWVYELSK